MGLGKTITCVSLIAATLKSALEFGSRQPEKPPPPPKLLDEPYLSAGHFSSAVWGMPETRAEQPSLSKGKGKRQRNRTSLPQNTHAPAESRRTAGPLLSPVPFLPSLTGKIS